MISCQEQPFYRQLLRIQILSHLPVERCVDSGERMVGPPSVVVVAHDVHDVEYLANAGNVIGKIDGGLAG